jgi:sulfoxide reductase heme-binding subunit YedZ
VHLTSNPAAWYAARAGGVVAYVLVTSVVLLGLQMSSRRKLQRWPRIAIEDVHRFAAFAAGAFVVIHIGAIAIDSYLPFSLQSLVVPFISKYRPAWVGLGIVAAELMLAVAIATWLRGRLLSYNAWRRTHYATFAVWGTATVHGIASGTDRSSTWLIALMVTSTGAVAGMTAWRMTRRRMRFGAALAVATVASGLLLVLALGPFRTHTKAWNAGNFSDELTGSISRRSGAARGIVSLAGSGSGDQRVLVRADLLLAPGGLQDTAFQMEYLPSGDVCRGRVTQITEDGLGFDADCRMPNGDARSVHASWVGARGADLAGGTIDSSA